MKGLVAPNCASHAATATCRSCGLPRAAASRVAASNPLLAGLGQSCSMMSRSLLPLVEGGHISKQAAIWLRQRYSFLAPLFRDQSAGVGRAWSATICNVLPLIGLFAAVQAVYTQIAEQLGAVIRAFTLSPTTCKRIDMDVRTQCEIMSTRIRADIRWCDCSPTGSCIV